MLSPLILANSAQATPESVAIAPETTSAESREDPTQSSLAVSGEAELQQLFTGILPTLQAALQETTLRWGEPHSEPQQPATWSSYPTQAELLAQTESTDGGLRITVTGTRNPTEVNKVPATINVYDLEDFERYQVQTIEDLLRYEPGVTVRDNLEYGLQDVNIRGIEGNRVLFQLDNIRLPERFEFGPFNLGRGNYVDFATLKAVEVLRGPASTLYGSDALGGVFTYRSLEPGDLLSEDDDAVFDVASTYTSANGGLNHVARLAQRWDNTEALFMVSRRDGYQTDTFADDTFEDSIYSQGLTVFGHLVQQVSPTATLSFIAEDFNRDTARNESPAVLDVNGLNTSKTEDIILDRTRLSVTYEYDDPDSTSFLNFARGQFFYQDAQTREVVVETRDSGSGAFTGQPVRRDTENKFTAESYGGEVQLRSDFTTGTINHQLTYGLDFSSTFNTRPRDRTQTNLNTGETTNEIPPDTFPVKDFPDGRTLRLGAYLQDEVDFGPLDLIVGLRLDTYELNTQPDELFSRSGAQASDIYASALSPRLALIYEVTPGISVYGQYSRGFRAPLYSEINSGFTNFTSAFFKYETLSNPDLEPETSDSYEIGIRGSLEQFDFHVTGFYNRYNNFIETFADAGTRCLSDVDPCPEFNPPFSFDTQVVNQFQSQNVADARIYGLEFGGEYRFDDNWSLLASFAWAQGDNLIDNTDLTTVNPITAVAGLRYRSTDEKWGTELIMTTVGSPKVDDNTTNFVPEPFTVFDLITSYRPTPDLSFSLGLYNIGNQQYYNYSEVRTLNANQADIERYSQPGTNVRFGLKYSF
ncbi:MAG: TonB-dependent hemoglobin/transferrin/lactoferrin family receptor [Cyanobacteria bacterium P01_G01_bin.54]